MVSCESISEVRALQPGCSMMSSNQGSIPSLLNNKVIFLAGPLAGTIIPCGSRLGVYTKSPLTNGFFHSSAGGHFAPELKYAGYDGVIIEGASQKPVYLYVDNERAELRDATHIWGEKD